MYNNKIKKSMQFDTLYYHIFYDHGQEEILYMSLNLDTLIENLLKLKRYDINIKSKELPMIYSINSYKNEINKIPLLNFTESDIHKMCKNDLFVANNPSEIFKNNTTHVTLNNLLFNINRPIYIQRSIYENNITSDIQILFTFKNLEDMKKNREKIEIDDLNFIKLIETCTCVIKNNDTTTIYAISPIDIIERFDILNKLKIPEN
jgi:hypothetical protein